MLISAKESPVAFMCLSVWDKSDELIPIIKWFNTETMIASVPTQLPNSELRREVGRFEFVVRSEYESKSLASHFPKGEEHLTDYIELVLED